MEEYLKYQEELRKMTTEFEKVRKVQEKEEMLQDNLDKIDEVRKHKQGIAFLNQSKSHPS